jgi:hypothetical protein
MLILDLSKSRYACKVIISNKTICYEMRQVALNNLAVSKVSFLAQMPV